MTTIYPISWQTSLRKVVYSTRVPSLAPSNFESGDFPITPANSILLDHSFIRRVDGFKTTNAPVEFGQLKPSSLVASFSFGFTRGVILDREPNNVAVGILVL